jgi:hypothetical protein
VRQCPARSGTFLGEAIRTLSPDTPQQRRAHRGPLIRGQHFPSYQTIENVSILSPPTPNRAVDVHGWHASGQRQLGALSREHPWLTSRVHTGVAPSSSHGPGFRLPRCPDVRLEGDGCGDFHRVCIHEKRSGERQKLVLFASSVADSDWLNPVARNGHCGIPL